MLPIKATMDDVDAVVNYLKTKPAGATVAEAKAVVGSSPMDGRKVKAYERWGLVEEKGGRLHLTERGRRMASRPEERELILRGTISKIAPYRSIMERAYHQDADQLTVDEVAAFWFDHHKDTLGTDKESTLKAMVTCFFNLAEGAGLGNYLLGRRGTPTRIVLDRVQLKEFVEGGPTEPPWSDDESELETLETEAEEAGGEEPDAEETVDRSDEGELDMERESGRQSGGPPPRDDQALKVFISHGHNMDIVDQVETILDLADIEKEVAVKEETAAVPVPKKVMDAMRRCQAGIICVSVDEGLQDGDGNFTINPNVLIEIGAAFVLYDEKVVLLWDKRLPVPSNLQGLYRCEFEGDNLDWHAGTRLMKAVRSFKD